MILRREHAALVLLCVLSVTASARETKAVPLPDWSGQWEIVGSTPSATGGMEQSLEQILREIDKWGPPPYTPQARAQFEQVLALVTRNVDTELAGGPIPGLTRPNCVFGYPAVMIHSPLMFEILPTPKETVINFSGREMREIYTDGRHHPAEDDLWPSPWGDSIGHWQGQTLVIDTIAVGPTAGNPGVGLFAFGGDANEGRLIAFFSSDVHFIEKIRMTDHDHLVNQMTIIDPVLFTAPWHISREYRRVRRINRMIHEDCDGEDRNPIVNGQYTLAPPPPPPPPPSNSQNSH